MRHILVAVLLATLLPAFAESAQTRRRRSAPSRPAATAPAPSPEKREAARRVADQITSLTQFLYLLGGAVKSLEAADAAARGADVPAEVRAQTEQSRARILESFRNVRVGLDTLEGDFSAKPALRPFYASLIGAAGAATEAERLAATGRFDQAGRTLLAAMPKLAGTLVAMGAQ